MANLGYGVEGKLKRMTRPDKFLLACDIAGIEPADITDSVRNQLTANAEAFLVAGGRLSLDDWAGLSLESRSAFVAAGKRLRSDAGEKAKGTVMKWP